MRRQWRANLPEPGLRLVRGGAGAFRGVKDGFQSVSRNMKSIRVVHYNHTGVVAGAERVLLSALPRLRAEQIDSVVVSPGGPLQEELTRCGAVTRECFPLQARFTWNPVRLAQYFYSFGQSIWRLRSDFKALEPDVVHANSVRAGLVATFATVGIPLPVIWHVHDALPRHPLSLLIRAAAAISRRTSFIAVSHATARTFAGKSARRWLQDRIVVLHNVSAGEGVDLSPMERSSLRAEFAAENKFLVGCIGQICARKNQIGLVEAFPEVLKSCPQAVLMIVGAALFANDFAYEQRLRRRVQELGLEGRVLLTGKRRDVPRLLAAIDLLVLPSRHEPFAMILLEAMAAGLPIVAYEVDGVPELLTHGISGRLVRAGDISQLTEALVWAITHPQERTMMACAAREELSRRDTPEVYGRRLASFFRSSLHAAPGPQRGFPRHTDADRLEEIT